MKTIAKTIRILTVAPIMALILLLTLYLGKSLIFGGPVIFTLSILFLVVFPLLAYPLQPFIKKYKDKGRDGQRTLAMLFAVAGYISGCLIAVFLHAPKGTWIIFLTYLLSGIIIMLFNKLLHYKASGHACGVAGPFTMLIYFGQPIGYIGIPVLAAVWLSSLYMKRHTASQLTGGTIIPIAALGIVVMLCSIA